MELDFKKNLGNIDRIIRVFIGVVLLGLVVSGIITGGWGIFFVLFALSQFVEAALAY